MNMLLLFAFLLYLRIANCLELPTGINKCHFGDDICIKNSINQFIKLYPKGLPHMNISPLDEFRPTDLLLYDTPKVGALWKAFNMRKQVFSGCQNATVTRVSGFDQDPTKGKLEIDLHIPVLTLRSLYDMQLRWLSFVQSNTTGLCYVEFQNISILLDIKATIVHRKYKRFLKIHELVPEVTLGRMVVQVDDLFKDNTDLTIAMNNVYNDNWLELWNDIKPIMVPSYSKKGAQLLDKIFENIPYDDMFLPTEAN